MTGKQDKAILRGLAGQLRDLAADEANRERVNRIKQIHNLVPLRPPVWIEELPWHELDINGELRLACESTEAQDMERFFRRTIFRWKYFQADMVVEDAFYIYKAYSETGIGLAVRERTVNTSLANNIVSHRYEDQLDTEEKVEALKLPVLTAYPDEDKRKLEIASDILDGIMPVKLRGHPIYYSPWDTIATLRGIENCLMDMIGNSDLAHKTIAKFTEIYTSRINQMEALGLLDFNIPHLHCTPPYTDALPAADYTGGKVRLKDIWFRGMGQLFSAASPAMQDEFDLQYMRPTMEKCGLSYYGCCEPLDRFIPYLKKVPNMRKIGVTPWANVRSCAGQIGGDYVAACKLNPANVAGDFNRDAVRKEVSAIIEACLENKCPYDLVLKDVSTVSNRPQNLIDWAQTVTETVNRYYH